MKRLTKGVAVLSMILSIALFAGCGGKKEGGAGEASKKENPITAGKTGSFELEGEIADINTILNTFILRTAQGDVEVYVRAMSRMVVDGERQSLSGIKSGSYAKGTFKKWDGKDTVADIVITAGK